MSGDRINEITVNNDNRNNTSNFARDRYRRFQKVFGALNIEDLSKNLAELKELSLEDIKSFEKLENIKDFKQLKMLSDISDFKKLEDLKDMSFRARIVCCMTVIDRPQRPYDL